MDFSAINESDFIKKLKQLETIVPPRGRERTTDLCERWQIHALLAALHNFGYFRFPFSLTKRERPDFKITSGPISIGIEAIEAINPDYARAQTLPEAKEEDSILDPSFFKWGQPRYSIDELRDISSRKQLTGRGWHGDNVEIEFATSILDCIYKKHRLLVNGFDRFDSNCLLIYHNAITPCLNFNKSTIMLEEKLKHYWSSDGFDTIFILKYQSVFILKEGISTIIGQ
ncbi:hypothetical protein [Aeromonas enteropelogenes]|uniref:hypothetical protein n=1 Tax=Aeromonas enteropelogenes TaxID=29489 RepID=UPI003F745CFB